MKERRHRRSNRTNEALELLLESVRQRSEVSAIAIVDGRGLIVAGAGAERELMVLGTVAAPAAAGTLDASFEKLTEGTDVLSRPIVVGEKKMYLAALGERVARMPEAGRSAQRILKTGS